MLYDQMDAGQNPPKLSLLPSKETFCIQSVHTSSLHRLCGATRHSVAFRAWSQWLMMYEGEVVYTFTHEDDEQRSVSLT